MLFAFLKFLLMTFQSKVVLCLSMYAAESVVLLHARSALSNLEPIDFNIIKTFFFPPKILFQIKIGLKP